MFGKFKWLAGFGAGYVLGARAGRERYDQIARRAQQVWGDPRVQDSAGRATQVLREKADQAQQVVMDKVVDQISGSGGGSTVSSGARASSGSRPSRTSVSSGSSSGAGGGKPS